MASFLDLPNELLREILSLTSPDDIEHVALLSKRIYSLSDAIVKDQREMRQKCLIYLDRISKGSLSLTDFLCIVLQNEKLKFYVEEIDIPEWRDDYEFDDRIFQPYSDEERVLLKSAIEEVFPGESEEALLDIESGNEDAAVGMLLFLLSHLKKLSWSPEILGSPTWTFRILESVVKTSGRQAPLSQLKNVRINDAVIAEDDLESVARFAALPGLSKLHARAIQQDDNQWEMGISYYTRMKSSVTELKLLDAAIHSKCFFEFLGGFTALQIFEWDGICTVFPDGSAKSSIDDNHFDPFWIRTALLMHAGSTLTHLTLLSHSSRPRWIGELHGFSQLRTVHTELQLLMRDGRIHFLRQITNFKCMGDAVSDLLPDTVVNLKLQVSSETEADQVLPRLIYLWSSEQPRLSGLKQIELVMEEPDVEYPQWKDPYTYNTLKNRYDALHVELDVVKYQDMP